MQNDLFVLAALEEAGMSCNAGHSIMAKAESSAILSLGLQVGTATVHRTNREQLSAANRFSETAANSIVQLSKELGVEPQMLTRRVMRLIQNRSRRSFSKYHGRSPRAHFFQRRKNVREVLRRTPIAQARKSIRTRLGVTSDRLVERLAFRVGGKVVSLSVVVGPQCKILELAMLLEGMSDSRTIKNAEKRGRSTSR